MCPWESYFTSLSLIFLTVKMEIRLFHRISVRISNDICEVRNIVFGIEQLLSEQWLPFMMRMRTGFDDGGEDNVQDKPTDKRGPLIWYLAYYGPAQFTMIRDLRIFTVKSSLCVQPMNSFPLGFCDQLFGRTACSPPWYHPTHFPKHCPALKKLALICHTHL